MNAWRTALVDLYDTIAWTEWPRLRDLFCQRLGIESERLLEAFDLTRPARSIGTYPDSEGDLAAVLAAIGINDGELSRELAELERAFLQDGVHLYEDSLPTLAALKERGVRTAIVSNCSHSTGPTVRRLGLTDVCDSVVLSFEVGAKKPDPEIYREALARVGNPAPGSVVFVDDQERYCDGARALGMQTRLIVRGLGPDPIEGSPAGWGDHPVITELRSLLE